MRRASLVPAEGKQEENASEVAEVPTSSPEAESRPKRANIMTNLPPQDMEGISELGRDGKTQNLKNLLAGLCRLT
jgi:hypothetical protein